MEIQKLVYGGIGVGFLSYGSYVHKLYMGVEARYYWNNFYLFGGIEPRFLKIYNKNINAAITESPAFFGIGIKL